MPVEDNHEEKFGIPSFDELGLPSEEELGSGVWIGGETQALNLLQTTIKEVIKSLKPKMCCYSCSNKSSLMLLFLIQSLIQLLKSDNSKSKQPDNSPFPKSSKLSPYLRFGCISPRLVFHEMTKLASKV
jgi:hypothetical protein